MRSHRAGHPFGRSAVRYSVAAAALLGTASAVTAISSPLSRTASEDSTYIVRAVSEAQAARAVGAAGGTVLAGLDAVHGVSARLNPASTAVLAREGSVRLTPDRRLAPVGQDYSASALPAQLSRMDLGPGWSAQAGTGVGVALIDTGVADTPGIDPSRLVRSPDFSGSGDTGDEYGHGTFMAGLISGNGYGGTGATPGAAPGATLVSVKVAGADGSTTLSQVLQGIGWAIDNETTYGIRVMSLSFGADFAGPPAINPLDQAVEAAWKAGITVVAAAGNEGAGGVTSPGDDPTVITAGAETTTGPVQAPTWSSFSAVKPDVLAPGVSVVSLRAPGSTIDTEFPDARVGDLYFVGSGTSMSTALTAGAAAVLIGDHPSASPNQVKAALLSASGAPLSGPAGPIDVAAADSSSAWNDTHLHQPAPGGGAGAASPNGVQWGTMRWGTMRWGTMRWGAMRWDSIRWDGASWTTSAGGQ